MQDRRDELIARELAGLPGCSPPPGAFRAAARRAARPPATAAAGRAWTVAAAAATMVLAVAVLLRAGPPSEGRPPAPLAWAPPAELLAESARLEAQLAALPRQAAQRVGTAYTISLLEDRLALVDDELSAATLEPGPAGAAEELWHERVALMDSLVRVRYAEALAGR
ncbi:MAG: hypothetical protein MUC71_10545 [Steroidobacteraceae bacterium]|jgi:hypothetical protein|nr:hypothetical protein [Steroidobacteraceae bacterium]